MKYNQIFKRGKLLRRRGFSLREISLEIGISKSTASLWFRNIKLSDKAEARIDRLCNVGRRKAIRTIKNKIDRENEFINRKVEKYLKKTKIDSKMACSLLYWCEGNKNKSNSSVSFTNSDPEMINYFLYVFRNSFKLDEKKFRALIHLHEYHNPKKQLKFWSGISKIPVSQFNRPYLKPNTGKNKRKNYPGCVNIKYFDSKIYKELIFITRKLSKIYKRG